MSNNVVELMQELEDKAAPISQNREIEIFNALENDGILYRLYGRYPNQARAMARKGVLKLNGDLKPC